MTTAMITYTTGSTAGVAAPVALEFLAWLLGGAVTSYVASKTFDNTGLELPEGMSIKEQLNLLMMYGTIVIVKKVQANQTAQNESDADEGTSEAEGKSEEKSKSDDTITSNEGNEYNNKPSSNHKTTNKNPGLKGEPNSSVDIYDKNGNLVTRRWFGPDGEAVRDIHYTNHGNPKTHPEVPHEHIW